MRYIYLNLACLGFLFCASAVLSNDSPDEEEPLSEEAKAYEPNYDKIISEYERDVDVHNS